MKFSEEHKRKISEGNKGKKLSAETRRKISESLKGRTASLETRKKLIENNKSSVPIIIHDCHTGKEIEFKSQIKGYKYLKSIGVKCSIPQYRGYLLRMAKGQEIIYPRAKDLYRYVARYK